jgi:hypothetical protein
MWKGLRGIVCLETGVGVRGLGFGVWGLGFRVSLYIYNTIRFNMREWSSRGGTKRSHQRAHAETSAPV